MAKVEEERKGFRKVDKDMGTSGGLGEGRYRGEGMAERLSKSLCVPSLPSLLFLPLPHPLFCILVV